MGIVTFTVQSAGSPVDNALVSVLSEDGDVIASSITDAGGKALFDLIEGLDYFITASHNSYNITTYKLPGLEIGTFDLIAEAKELVASNDPNVCIISGVFTDISNVRLDSWTFSVAAAEGYSGTDSSIFYGDMPVTAKEGNVELSLINDTSYIFSNLPFCESKSVYVPNARSAKLVDLLLPVVTQIDGAPLAIAMSPKEKTEVDLVLTLSNTLTGSDVPAGMLSLKFSKDNIISASISATYKLTIESSTAVGDVDIIIIPAVNIEEGIYSRLPTVEYARVKVSIE